MWVKEHRNFDVSVSGISREPRRCILMVKIKHEVWGVCARMKTKVITNGVSVISIQQYSPPRLARDFVNF